uniref:VWFA domain-containing protein n=1 Tax=Candidatus Kentrum sp. MB TaxID=2138164 RepID=A0A450X9V0_9GAMM|nr:MAG: hypothetical protein BECKMB1821G_GA0114241_101821 [Candidatus Kentron sp. MB]
MKALLYPVVILCLLMTIFPRLVAANPEAAGVDIVVLIDQSGSMMGKGATNVINDRYGKRISFFDSLTPKLVLSAKRRMTNRLSVVEFGGRNATHPQYRPQLTLSEHVIHPIHRPSRNEADVHSDIRSGLMNIKEIARGDTDHPAALKLARQKINWFLANPVSVPPGGKPGSRQRLVVLITDGQSYVAISRKKNTSIPPNQLKKETERETAIFTRDAKFLIFGINDKSNYWEQGWGDFWRGLATPDPQSGEGHAYLVQHDEIIAKIITSLAPLIPPPSQVITEDYHATVPPYLKALNVLVDFVRPRVPTSKVQIIGPDGKRVLPPSNAREWSNGMSFRIPHPAPGMWQLRQPDSPYRVMLDYELETAELTAPASPLSQHLSSPIRYRLSGRGPGRLFQSDPNFPIVHFETRVIDPAGSARDYRMDEDPANPGHMVSNASFQPTVSGEYRLVFSGRLSAVGVSQAKVPLYASEDPEGDRLFVNETIPVQLRIEAPGKPITLQFGSVEIPFTARFINTKDAQPLAPHEVLLESVLLSVSLSGGDENEKVKLKSDGEVLEAGKPLVLSAPFGRYLFNSGEVRFQIHAPMESFREDIYYQGIEGGGTWETANYVFREAWTTLALMAGVFLALVGTLAALWMLFGRRLLIARQDSREKQHPKLVFNMPASSSPTKQEWDLTGRSVVKDKTRVALDAGEDWELKGFKVRRKPVIWGDGKKVAVKFRYRPHGSDKGWEKVALETRNDDGKARRRVKGLDKEAYFILLRGEGVPSF